MKARIRRNTPKTRLNVSKAQRRQALRSNQSYVQNLLKNHRLSDTIE